MNPDASTLSRAGRRLWLVRHGESDWNARGLVQGHRDEPVLTARGTEQARRCAAALAHEPVRALYSSDLRRARQTAAAVAEALDLPVIEDPRLRERLLGAAEGRPSADLGPAASGIEGERVVDADAAPAGGESVRAFYARVAGVAEEVLSGSGPGDVALVCHGGVVRVLLAWLEGTGPDDMTWPYIENAQPICRPAGPAGVPVLEAP